MSHRASRIVQIMLMIWISLLFLVAWLPFVRSIMDGPSYEWGDTVFGTSFGGAGLNGDFWYPTLKAVLGLGLLYLGWRRPNGAARVAIATWLALVLADTLYSVATMPGSFRFRGDTLGIDISLVFIAPAIDAAMLALAAWWARSGAPLPTPPFGRANKLLLAAALLLLPVQYILLSGSEGQEAGDVIGVLLTIFGWFLLSASLAPWGARRLVAT